MTQSFLLSLVVVHKVHGSSANPCWACGGGSVTIVLSPPAVYVHTMYSLTQHCPLSHTVVAAAQQILAEFVEGDLGQRLNEPLLSWWRE